jgi:DNA-binding MarR family transcriptional regulator
MVNNFFGATVSKKARQADIQTVHAAIERLTRLCDLFQERREQLAGRVGLTEAQWEVLEEISTERFMPSMFAQREAQSRAAVSKVIRLLLDRGLVRVAISSTDGRQRDYALTADGKATLAKLRAEREKAIAAIWVELEPQALAQFSEFSAVLIDRIEQYARKHQPHHAAHEKE